MNSKIPLSKWIQVHESVHLLRLLAHETNHKQENIELVNQRAKIVLGVDFKVASSGIIMGISWMTLGRMYEVIDKYIVADDLNSLKRHISKQAQCQCSVESWQQFVSHYSLNIESAQGIISGEFQQSLWKILKLIRDSISHFDYEIDLSAGSKAENAVVCFDHSYKDVQKLKMNVKFDKFFMLVEHFTIWVDCALQENNMILENA